MRILIIEDERGILNFLKQGLEEEYYMVDTASEGKSGLDMALTGEYDLLLVDWMLPGKSGVEICREFGQVIILIVYLPIFTLQGIEGKMFKPMAQTVAFALLGAIRYRGA